MLVLQLASDCTKCLLVKTLPRRMSSLDYLEDETLGYFAPPSSLKGQATTVNLGIIFLVAFCTTIGIPVLWVQPYTPNFAASLKPRLARVDVWSWDNKFKGFPGNGTIGLQDYLGSWITGFV